MIAKGINFRLRVILIMALVSCLGVVSAIGENNVMANPGTVNIAIDADNTTAGIQNEITVENGSQFTVHVWVLPQDGQAVSVVDARVDFDTSYLSVDATSYNTSENIMPHANTLFGNSAYRAMDNTNGYADYSDGTAFAGTNPTTDFPMYYIVFNADSITSASGTQVTFHTAIPRKTDAFLTGSSITGTLTGITVKIQGTPTTAGDSVGSGGGGGAGLAGVTSVLDFLTEKGRFTEDVTAISEDKQVELYIPEDTIGKNRVGQLIYSIRIKKMEEPPTTPEQTTATGLIYDIGPSGATFDPPIDLTIKYDASLIPEGVAEKNLVVATFDSSTSQWVELESTVDPENDTITAKVSHFTAFTILAHTRPASFVVADLVIAPDEVETGETVAISVLVTNTGDLEGSYEATLKIDDVAVTSREGTLEGGVSEEVTFTTAKDVAGTYTVEVGGLVGTFRVKVAPAPIPTPAPELTPEPAPVPATFNLSALSISPAEVEIGEEVTVSITVTNAGGQSGSYKVILKVNNAMVDTAKITLAAGTSQEITFTTSSDTAGTYTVNVNGLSGTFAVKTSPTPVPTEPINWALIVWIIVGVLIVGGLLPILKWYHPARRH